MRSLCRVDRCLFSKEAFSLMMTLEVSARKRYLKMGTEMKSNQYPNAVKSLSRNASVELKKVGTPYCLMSCFIRLANLRLSLIWEDSSSIFDKSVLSLGF